MTADPLERIREALAWAGDDGEPVAIGWATVELDRAADELAQALGTTSDSFVPAADSSALGARCRVASAALPGGVALAILEPSTEGRLAATLARVGEGPVAVWSRIGQDLARDDPAARPGPFGRERLVPGGSVHGPHRFLIGTATGTIRP